MWVANIESKNFSKGVLQIGVNYTDGVEKFVEMYQISDQSSINSYISGRLQQLEKVTMIDVPIGQFDPQPTEIPLSDDEIAINKLRKLKDLASLGIIDPESIEITDALKEAQALIN